MDGTANLKSSALVLGLVSFIAAMFASVMTGVGWHILRSDDVCTGSMHTYVEAVTISSTIQLALFGFGFIIAMTSICSEVMAMVTTFYNVVIVILCTVMGSILNIVWFVWGIVLLSEHRCQGTIYNTLTIVLVVLSGISVLGNLCSQKTNRNM